MSQVIKEIEDCIHLGFSVKFERVPMNVSITVSHDRQGEQTQWLPLEDHITDGRVSECIKFMKNKLLEV